MKTVLFGNGLNYLSENFISWKQLLDKIKGDNLFENGQLPNTMIYERSIIGNPISFDTLTKKEEAIKNEIADMLKGFPGNKYYKKLAEVNAENYLTTNYDYAFLESYKQNDSFEIEDKSTEGLYSIRRHKEILLDKKLHAKIWHIHGEIEVAPSIMLGLDHYCGSVGKIDSYVKGRYEFQHNKVNVKTPSIFDKLTSKGKFDDTSWIELFFNSDVHIIGLGLDYSEIDLWWILNKRARLKLDNRTKKSIKNKIYFHTSNNDRDQTELLRTLDIEIVLTKLDGTSKQYENAYSQMIRKIKSAH